MDDIEVLFQRFADLTVQYESAVNRSYLASASMHEPVTKEGLQSWQDAVKKEREIQHEREELLRQIQTVLRAGHGN